MDGTSSGSSGGQALAAPPRGRATAGALFVVGGGGLVLLMALMLAVRAVLVAILVPDVPADANRGGLPVCTTWACIEEARTVYLALAMAVVALVVIVMTWLRGGRVWIAACLAMVVGVRVPALDPDLEPVMSGIVLGLVLVAFGTWLRLRAPIPPGWRAMASANATRFWERQVVPTFRDAFGKDVPSAPPDQSDTDPDPPVR